MKLFAGLMLVTAVGAACDSSAPHRLLAPSPIPAPIANQVIVENWEDVFADEKYGDLAPPANGGPYIIDWDTGWYCVIVRNVPATAEHECREYTYTFSWPPVHTGTPAQWSDRVWSSGCRQYPGGAPPYVCFQSPSPDSVGAIQSIAIVASERASGQPATESFRTELTIAFRQP